VVEQRWQKQYPRELESGKKTACAANVLQVPDICPAICTTNAIERTVKEMRKRL
jgi:transposase-like protein